jgi:uncharacterized protein YecT (DUF1311 family)
MNLCGPRHFLLAGLLLMAACDVCQAASLPDALLGRWQVAEVHINTYASWKNNYGWNDPQLRGRIFTFSNAQLSNDTADGSNCDTPQATVTSMSVMQLMDGSLAHASGDDSDPETHPSPAAYRLKIDPHEAVNAISVQCKDGLWEGDLGTGKGVEGAWMFLTHTEQLVLRWRDETILVLDRLPPNAKPQPSFDCAKASSAAEKAICGSIQLASFDRSVNWSYKVAYDDLKHNGDNPSPLVSSQQAWLRKRNACGSNVSCLLATMKQRLDELSSSP